MGKNLLEQRLGKGESSLKRGGKISRKIISEKKETIRISELEHSSFDEEKFELEQEIEDTRYTESLRKSKIRNAYAVAIGKVFLIVAIFYTIFLIYGAVITEYVYDDGGNVVPLVYSVDDIRNKENYELLHAHYITIRDLYEEIIVLDYRLATANEDYIQLSSEYEALLDTVNVIVLQLDAYVPPTEYRQTYNLMMQLIKTDIAVYLQNISAAIAQNNENKASLAVTNKETVYNTFLQTTSNMISLGSPIKGIDISDISDWNIEKVRQERIGIMG